MQEQLALFKDFTTSLDPLRANSKSLSVAAHSIFEHHSRGTTRYTGDYLHESVVTLFYDHLRSRNIYLGPYLHECSTYHANSLSDFVQRIGFMVGEIVDARARGRTDAASLTGSGRGRLPFTHEEIEVLKKLADSITR